MATITARPALFALLAPFAFIPVFGQQAGNCEQAFQAAFAAKQNLRMELRAADIEIGYSPDATVRVECRLGGNRAAARDISIRLDSSSGSGTLRIKDGPKSDVHFKISVPRETNLNIRVPAGNVTIAGITGDKDIEMTAGNLTIAGLKPDEYSLARGSVKAGDLNASAFGVNKGGLFQSFDKQNPKGKYRLSANVGAGNVTLQ